MGFCLVLYLWDLVIDPADTRRSIDGLFFIVAFGWPLAFAGVTVVGGTALLVAERFDYRLNRWVVAGIAAVAGALAVPGVLLLVFPTASGAGPFVALGAICAAVAGFVFIAVAKP